MAATPEAPPYEPGKWNTPATQTSHNCYDYACDDNRKRDPGHKSQPGRQHDTDEKKKKADGKKEVEPPYTREKVEEGAIADGFKSSTRNAKCDAPYCWKVALFILARSKTSPQGDYHWLRQDQGGGWSQKHGSLPATDKDDGPSHDPITDPEKADIRRPSTGEKYTFCGYFCVCRGEVTISMKVQSIPAGGALASVLLDTDGADPSWSLSKGDVAVIAEKLHELPRLKAPAKAGLAGLSFLIRAGSGNRKVPQYVVVSNGVLQTRDAEGKWAFWKDIKGLERWLLVSGSQSRIGKQLKAISAAMGSQSTG